MRALILGISKNTISGSLLDSNAGSVNDVNYSLLRIQASQILKLELSARYIREISSSRFMLFTRADLLVMDFRV
jgi:starvation-inducible outer membrane lipoprotein